MKKLILALCIALLMVGCAAQDTEPAAEATAPATATMKPAKTFRREPTPEPTPTPTPVPAIELIDEAPCPEPEPGDWYEWDINGHYPGNQNGGIFYDEKKDLLIREDGFLVVSHLDGSERTELDTCMNNVFNYLDGWIYYVRTDGIWRIKPDGTGKRLVIEASAEDLDDVYVYDGRIYCINSGEEAIESYDIDGGDHISIDVPDLVMTLCFFENGSFYYGGYSPYDEGSDCWDIYRYCLKTGKAVRLVRDANGPVIVRNGVVYFTYLSVVCVENGEMRPVLDKDNYWVDDFNIYRNLLFYFKNDNKYGADGNGTVYAYDLVSAKEYELFDLSDAYKCSFFPMENSVFICPHYNPESFYRITFKDGMAQLWRINTLSEEPETKWEDYDFGGGQPG